jgi:hypothetical protein
MNDIVELTFWATLLGGLIFLALGHFWPGLVLGVLSLLIGLLSLRGGRR